MVDGNTRLDIVGSLAAVDRSNWDRLAIRAGLFASYDWLKALETLETDVNYIVVRRDDSGRVLAGAPVYQRPPEANSYYSPDSRFPDLAVTHSSGSLGVLAGPSCGFRNAILVDPEAAEPVRRTSLSQLWTGVREIAAASSVPYFFILFLPATQLLQHLATLDSAVWRLSWGADAFLPTIGGSFDDYLASLAGHRRRNIRRELKLFNKAGLRVSLCNPSELIGPASTLIAQLRQRHGHSTNPQAVETQLRWQSAASHELGVAFACYSGNDLVGASIGFEYKRRLYMRAVGFDYARLSGAFEYFSLIIYEPLRFCYDRGLEGLELGAASHTAKALRGAIISPLVDVVVPVEGRPLPIADLQLRTRQRADYWRSQMSIASDSYPASIWDAFL